MVEVRSGGAIDHPQEDFERVDRDMDALRTQLSRVEVDMVRLCGERDVASKLLEPSIFAQVYAYLTSE